MTFQNDIQQLTATIGFLIYRDTVLEFQNTSNQSLMTRNELCLSVRTYSQRLFIFNIENPAPSRVFFDGNLPYYPCGTRVYECRYSPDHHTACKEKYKIQREVCAFSHKFIIKHNIYQCLNRPKLSE